LLASVEKLIETHIFEKVNIINYNFISFESKLDIFYQRFEGIIESLPYEKIVIEFNLAVQIVI